MVSKQASKRLRVLCSVAALALTMSGTQPFISAAPANDTEIAENRVDSKGYFAYMAPFQGAMTAEKELELSVTAPHEQEQTMVTPYLNKDAVLQMSTDGSATWQVVVEQSALYCLQLEYALQAEASKDSEITFLVDGKAPYTESTGVRLSRVWKDATAIQQDEQGNDRIPKQEVVVCWRTVQLYDYSLFTDAPLQIYLESGTHTITLRNVGVPLYVAQFTLTGTQTVPTAAETSAMYARRGYQATQGVLQKVDAERPYQKSDQSLYPVYDRTSPATDPYHVSKIRRNVIGQSAWSQPGMWITYEIRDVPADGLYYLTLKYRQNLQIGQSSFRTIYVNGEIPSAAFENVAFPYGVSWENRTISEETGAPCPLFLKAGRNEIKLQVSVGKWANVLQTVEAINKQLTEMYIQMVMVTGSSPDKYRDYFLDKEIPGLIDGLSEQAAQLSKAADSFDAFNGGGGTQSESIRRAASQLNSLVKMPKTIPQRLSNFRDTISNLSSWVYDSLYQPLELDYLLVHSADAELPSPRASFGAEIQHFFGTFFASFLEDYNSVGNITKSQKAITVWMNTGRDQIQVLKNMVLDDFTPNTGIPVNLSLVQSGFIEATLAGSGPDVAIGVARGQPVNLACRGAIMDLSGFETFDTVMKRFGDTATVPYTFNGGTYAVPNTQTFFMMFYRSDVLERLGIGIPQTWDELLKIVPRLQKNHMSVGLPYSVISAAAAVDNGLGSKDMFPVLLLQNKGTFYAPDASKTALDTEVAMSAFRQWSEFYTQYGFDLVYDFYTRFRNGEMPIGIASFDMYNTLVVAAPEIKNQWKMAPVPGTLDADSGEINRAVGGAGTGSIIFQKAHNPDSCWRFLDWWMSNESQYAFAASVENIMGPAGRHSTANLAVFDQLGWSREAMTALQNQRRFVQELPEIPGSYFVSRCLDNAFRSVLFDGKNAREVFERENGNINREIARKRNELGLQG